MAPLGVAGPLILFRKNGRVLHQWFGVVSPDDEEHSARPPLVILPALLVPCVALLVLVHPLVRVTVLRWPVFADDRTFIAARAVTMRLFKNTLRRPGCDPMLVLHYLRGVLLL